MLAASLLRRLPAVFLALSWCSLQAQAQGIPAPPAPMLPGEFAVPSGGHSMPPGPGIGAPAYDPNAADPAESGGIFGRWHRRHEAKKRAAQECFVGYLEEFNEWPLGASLYANARSQVSNGKAAQMVFYHYDFIDGSNQLNVRGQDKLARLAPTLSTCFNPLIVERTPAAPGLDQARRATLLAQLRRGPFPVPDERIVIGPSIARGLSGQESVVMYGNQLNHLLTSGNAAGATGSSGGTANSYGTGLSSAGVQGSGSAGR